MAPIPARTFGAQWRLTLASLASLAAALGFLLSFKHAPPLALAIPIGLLAAAAGLVWRPHLPSQLLARAALWSNLLLGALMSISASSGEQRMGGILALATGLALLALGRAGLDRPSPAFTPAAFRGTLILALVMALADTQSLALFGGLRLGRSLAAAAPLLACAALMVVAIVGLYRLRVWGLVVNIAANLLIAGLALAGALEVPRLLAWALATTALVQLALPLPLIVAILRGRPPAATAASPLRAALIPVVVVALMSLAALGLMTPGGLVDL